MAPCFAFCPAARLTVALQNVRSIHSSSMSSWKNLQWRMFLAMMKFLGVRIVKDFRSHLPRRASAAKMNVTKPNYNAADQKKSIEFYAAHILHLLQWKILKLFRKIVFFVSLCLLHTKIKYIGIQMVVNKENAVF
jgi:hypothetical protein